MPVRVKIAGTVIAIAMPVRVKIAGTVIAIAMPVRVKIAGTVIRSTVSVTVPNRTNLKKTGGPNEIEAPCRISISDAVK